MDVHVRRVWGQDGGRNPRRGRSVGPVDTLIGAFETRDSHWRIEIHRRGRSWTPPTGTTSARWRRRYARRASTGLTYGRSNADGGYATAPADPDSSRAGAVRRAVLHLGRTRTVLPPCGSELPTDRELSLMCRPASVRGPSRIRQPASGSVRRGSRSVGTRPGSALSLPDRRSV